MAEMNYIKTSQKEYSSNDSDKTASRKFTIVDFSKKSLGRVNVYNSSPNYTSLLPAPEFQIPALAVILRYGKDLLKHQRRIFTLSRKEDLRKKLSTI